MWERQPGETSKQFEAFSVYCDLRPNERSLRKAAAQLGKSTYLLEDWSRANNWVQRVEAWDDEAARVARQAQLDEIDRINREDVRIADAMMAQIEQAVPHIQGQLRNQPRALAELAKVAAKIRRDAAGIAEPKADSKVTVSGDPDAPIHADIAGIFAQLSPEAVLKARDLAIEVAQAKARELSPAVVVSQPSEVSPIDTDGDEMTTDEGYPAGGEEPASGD